MSGWAAPLPRRSGAAMAGRAPPSNLIMTSLCCAASSRGIPADAAANQKALFILSPQLKPKLNRGGVAVIGGGQPLEWRLQPGPANLKYKVTLYGATEAYIASSCARAEIMDSLEPPDDAKWWPALSIPQVISPNNRAAEGVVQGIFPRMDLEQPDIEA